MLQWGGEAAQKLGVLMIQMCGQYTLDIGQTDPDKPHFEWSAEMWANIFPQGVGHESHTHPGALRSLVFYVDNGLPEDDDDSLTGEIVLQDPRNPTPVMYKPDLRYLYEDKTVYKSDHRFTPKAGQIIAFPSRLSHWVNPHRGSRERISIAMNTIALRISNLNRI